jgi:activator of HSP90 ATPase
MNGHPTLEVYSPKPPVLNESKLEKTDSQMRGSLITINQSIEFMCSASDLYDALVNPNKVAVWTRGSLIAKPAVGEAFSLFHGNITGTWKELAEPEKLVFTWRLSSWPAGHESIVHITLAQGSDSTMLRLSQEKVPIGIKELTESNWKSYYWNAIMGTFGYGANF